MKAIAHINFSFNFTDSLKEYNKDLIQQGEPPLTTEDEIRDFIISELEDYDFNDRPMELLDVEI